MTDETILNNVINYKNKETVRFHMPGHKGRRGGTFLDTVLPYDLTELAETGDFYDPEPGGAVIKTMQLAEKLFGAGQTVISAGGATLALQAAVYLAVSRYLSQPNAENTAKKTANIELNASNITPRMTGVPILCARNIHRSAVYAMDLCGAEPVWLDGKILPPETGAAAALVTSPDYYGNIADIKTLAEALKRRGIPLIVDNSHGTHLAFHGGGELHPLKTGAALVVDSLHKTLPAMTGCALLHSDGSFQRGEMLSAMRLFATTSPSFILQCSAAACLEFMGGEGRAAMPALLETASRTKRELLALGFGITGGANGGADSGGALYDPYRLCIIDRDARRLYRFLADGGVVCEFADERRVVLIPTVMNTDEDFARLTELCSIYRRENGTGQPLGETGEHFLIPEKKLSLREALFAPSETLETAASPGRVCAEPVTPYPPGVPLVMPGELYSAETAALLTKRGITRVKAVKNQRE